MSQTPQRKTDKHLIAVAVLILLTVAIYWQTRSFAFVWDDDYFVVQNEAIRSWHMAPRYFTDVSTYSAGLYAPMYRPFRNLSFLLDYKLFGLRPAGWHLHNMILHGGNSVLLFFLIASVARLLRNTSETQCTVVVPALAAAIWCVHPIQTEAVAWIKERDELLFTMFSMGALLLAAQGLLASRISASRHTAIIVLTAAALLSKEMAITMPLLLGALAVLTRTPRQALQKLMPSLAGSIIVCVLFLVARHYVIGRTSQVNSMSGSRFADALTTICAFARYVRISVVPTQLIADYSGYPITRSILEPRFVLSALLLAAVAVVAVALRQRAALATFGILFYFIALLPVSNIIPTMQFLAERFLYFPLVGYSLVIACAMYGLNNVFARQSRSAGSCQVIPVCAFVGYTAILGYCTVLRLPDWKNSDSLHQSTYEHAPRSTRIQLTHASRLVSSGKYIDGLKLAREIEAKNEEGFRLGDNPVLARVLGVSLLRTGETTSSLPYLERSVEMRPNDPAGLGALALYYGLTGDHRSAMKYYKAASDNDPRDHVMRNNYLRAVKYVEQENVK